MLQTISKEGNALLSAIRNSESSTNDSAYKMRFSGRGGKTFNDFSKHPNIREAVPWRTDGKTSDAAGAYQFLSSTFNPLAKKYGINDFTPASQDKAAWILAQENFRNKTGGDLQTALEAGQVGKVFSALSTTWTSLPSGKEQNKLSGKALSTYNNALKADRLTSGAQILANPLGYLTGKISQLNPVSTVVGAVQVSNELANITGSGNSDVWYMRIGYALLGVTLLTVGLMKLKV